MSEKKLTKIQSWIIFLCAIAAVFALGFVASALMERRSEVASIFNNRKTPMSGIVAQNQKFKSDFPREYETWRATEETDFRSKYMSSDTQDVLEERPNMVILWAGYAFSWDYNSPPVAISMRWTTTARFSVPAGPTPPPPGRTSPEPAGPARDLTCPG